MVNNIIKNNILDNNIVGNNIFLRPEEAMLKTWQKLVLDQHISVYKEYHNLVLQVHDTKKNEKHPYTDGKMWLSLYLP